MNPFKFLSKPIATQPLRYLSAVRFSGSEPIDSDDDFKKKTKV